MYNFYFYDFLILKFMKIQFIKIIIKYIKIVFFFSKNNKFTTEKVYIYQSIFLSTHSQNSETMNGNIFVDVFTNGGEF